MANDNDKKSIDLTLTPDDQPEAAPAPQQEAEDLTDKDLDTTGVEIHTDESSAEVTAVEADYGAEQIQILEQDGSVTPVRSRTANDKKN